MVSAGAMGGIFRICFSHDESCDLLLLQSNAEIIFKIMDIPSNVMENYFHLRTAFVVDGHHLPIHSFKCRQDDQEVECIILSDGFVFDTLLVEKSPLKFEFSVRTKYPFNKSPLMGSSVVLKWTKRFVAMFSHSSTDYDVFVYKRDFSQPKNNLFGAIPLEQNSKITQFALSDWKEEEDGQKVDRTSLFVSQFSLRKGKTNNFSRLSISEYEVDEFRLRVNTELTSMSEEFKIKGRDFQMHYHQYQMEVKLDHNARHKGLMISVFILAIILIGCLGAFFTVLRENKRIKMRFLEEDRDAENFNDITVLRV